MRFVYYYKSSDAVRHEGEIDAASRDDAFQELRKQGIRPIKVIARDSSRADDGSRRWAGARAVVVVLAFGLIATLVYFLVHRDEGSRQQGASVDGRSTVETDGTVALVAEQAKPYSRRQLVPLDDDAIANIFVHPSERCLMRFACPGVLVPATNKIDDALVEDFIDAMDTAILLKESDTKAVRDWKRVVTGLKNEVIQSYNSGKSIPEIIMAMEARQQMEADYHEGAIKELIELRGAPNYDSRKKLVSEIFDAMGFAPIPDDAP